MDIDLLRRLHKKVNVVLAIAKADTLTTAEVKKLKKNIVEDLEKNHINLYQFPEIPESDEDDEFKQQDRDLKDCVPFAVVGSNTILEVAGKKVRGRQYPWGVVDGKLSVKQFHLEPFVKTRFNYLLFFKSRTLCTATF